VARSRRAFTVCYEKSRDGSWTAEVVQEPTVRARGSTLAAVEAKVRGALARALSSEEQATVAGADLTLQSRVSMVEADLVERVERQRAVARRAEADAASLEIDAARELVVRRKLSFRDAAYLLGVTPARIKQMLGTSTMRVPRPAT
jgi:predicted RNase H-like HicB family nuclease